MKLPQVSLYLDVRKLVDKGRGHQLKLRVKRPGANPDYFELDGHVYTKAEYHSIQNSKRPTKMQYELRAEISEHLTRAQQVIKDLGANYTKSSFEKRLFGIDPNDMSIDAAFARYIQSRVDMEKPLAPATEDMYNESKRHLKEFHKKKLQLQDIDAPFLRRWQKWMEGRGMDKTTVRIYSDRLRAVFNYEIKKKRISIDLYPFGKTEDDYQAPKTSKKKVSPTLPTMARIFEQPPNKGRDFFLLTYLMNGMNMADILRIQEKHFVSEKELRYIRQKTRSTSTEETTITVALIPQTWEIINRWATRKLDPESYIFDVLEHGLDEREIRKRVMNFTTSVNYYFNKMLEEMGLPRMTTYNARHAFAKVLDNAGVSLSDIQRMLGHKSRNTTEIYTGSIDFDESIEKQEAIVRVLVPKKAS